MLAIAQISDSFYYLHWIPSDRGPLVTQFGEVSFSNISQKEPDYYSYLIQSILQKLQLELPVFTFTLDSSEVLFSQTNTHPEFSSEELVHWQLKQSTDQQFLDSYRVLSYSLTDQENILLNIHIPNTKIQSIDQAMKKIYGEMRSICVGIFSAEIGARSWMNAGKYGSYIIWRMGKYNSDQLLYVKNNELVAYCHSKRSINSLKKMTLIGDEKVVDVFFEDLNNFHSGSTDPFKSAEMVYVYQGEGKSTELKKICESGIDNIRLLNPLSVLKCEEVSKGNLYLNSQLAETGVSFRGIDV
ncbi:MAG: hypothetical protein HQ510_01960 [Candidatus Marinimicrobia bacterium]|nr:hypothetical protein [Candidatus Neomarinimicrobiota bacterium]